MDYLLYNNYLVITASSVQGCGTKWKRIVIVAVVLVECCSFKKFVTYVYFHSQPLMHLFDQQAEVQGQPENVYEIWVDVIQ